MGAPDSAMGDPLILNGLIEMLRNGQGQNITMMVHEAISKVVPTPIMPFSTSSIMPAGISRESPPRMHLVGMQDPTMPSDTPNVMQKDVSRCVMPSTSRLETPITRVPSSAIPHSMPSTSNMDAPSFPVEMEMHAPVMSSSQIHNPSSLGSVRILPPTPKQVSLRSLIESQSRILRILPKTLENAEIREEIIKQIELWERTLLGSVGLTSDEQEINDKVIDATIGASTSTPKTTTISSVTTKGMQEVTILLTSEGNVLKDETGLKFFHFIFRRAEQLFGNPGFNKEIIVDIAWKYIHSKRDNLRSKLTKDLRYPRPAWITDQVTWDELMKDAKFKRKAHNNPNYRPSAQGGSKRCLRDTTKATQTRVSSIGSHKLGSGGYNSIRGGLVHQFQKEASKEDLKYALLHGSQGLQQHMLDRGEKLVTSHESEEVQQSNSLGSEREEGLEEHDELFVAHNDSIVFLEPRHETILEFQQVGDKNNEEGVQCDEQLTPTIRRVPHITIVPRRKRT